MLNATLKAKVDGVIKELAVKSSTGNIFLEDNTILSAKLAEIVTSVNEKAKKTEVSTEIDTKLSAAVSELIGGAPETYDTLKEVADYIAQHKTVVDALNAAIGNKVDKESGKGLSTNDFTKAFYDKLNAIEDGATRTVVDNSLSTTSLNPVQNKVITAALNSKSSIIYSATEPASMKENDIWIQLAQV